MAKEISRSASKADGSGGRKQTTLSQSRLHSHKADDILTRQATFVGTSSFENRSLIMAHGQDIINKKDARADACKQC